MALREVSHALAKQISALFTMEEGGQRSLFAGNIPHPELPDWHDHLLFHEYFHDDNGAGLGACHRTDWTALVTKCLGIMDRVDER